MHNCKCKTKKLNVNIKKLHPDSKIPQYQTAGAAAMDLCANLRTGKLANLNLDVFYLYPGERQLIDTGIAVELPEGYEAQIRPRSGLALHNGISIVNSPGTIDCITLDSKISTPNGDLPLDIILKNKIEYIYSYNVDDDNIEIDNIVDIWKVGERDIIEIEFDDDSLVKCTLNQLILTNKGWKKAEDLTLSDNIVSI